MDQIRRRQLADAALAGYAHGPTAPAEATERALSRAGHARAIILVEGISDQMAVETVAPRLGRDLDAEGVVVLPVGGAQAFRRYLARFGPEGTRIRITGFFDLGEAPIVGAALRATGFGSPVTHHDMERLGFHVCTEDLEDELIRSASRETLEALVDAQGDLGSLRSLQGQPQWRDREWASQFRRFLGSGARRKLRYARLMAASVEIDRLPRALLGVLGET